MTDEQIIKEFDLFLKHSAPEKLLNDVLDLINRQKAEIERLKISNDALRMSIELCKGWEERAKTDAIKELFERLEKLFETYPDDEEASALYLINKINEIVKEMKR